MPEQATEQLPQELQQLAEELKQAESGAVETTPDVIDIEVAGSHFKGTKDEVLEKLRKSVESANPLIAEARQWKTELEQLRQQVQRSAPVADATTSGFDAKKYEDLMGTGKYVEAQNYLDAFRLGLSSPEDVPNAYKYTIGKVRQFDEQATAAAFLARHPEFPQGNREAAQMLLEDLHAKGRAVTSDALDLTYYELRESGRIAPASTQDASSAASQTTATTMAPPPPPTGSTGGAGNIDAIEQVAQQIATLPTEQAHALLVKLGLMSQ